jgi:hypothetical protein
LFGEARADVFENAEGLHEALQRQCDREFADRLQFAVPAALNRFEAVEFEAHDAVDDTHLFQAVAEICGHFSSSLVLVLRTNSVDAVLFVVMAGLDPWASTPSPPTGSARQKDVDHRVKPGDDDFQWKQMSVAPIHFSKPDSRGLVPGNYEVGMICTCVSWMFAERAQPWPSG